jgi:quercetin dioxygenase-like cupin family protein
LATLTSTQTQPAEPFDWGAITWLCSGRIDPEAQMTFGVVHIEPGRANPRHHHPNCEECIFVLSGECDHSLGDEVFRLRAGSMLRIPQGVYHHAVNTGAERVRMVIAYSSPDRQTVGEDPHAFR